MRDELKGKASKNECLILNIDHSNNNGTHWVSLFIKNGVCYYFDSYGFAPPLEIIDYCNNFIIDYSTYQIQMPGEVICGHYCIYVLYRLSSNTPFLAILNELFKCSHKNIS